MKGKNCKYKVINKSWVNLSPYENEHDSEVLSRWREARGPATPSPTSCAHRKTRLPHRSGTEQREGPSRSFPQFLPPDALLRKSLQIALRRRGRDPAGSRDRGRRERALLPGQTSLFPPSEPPGRMPIPTTPRALPQLVVPPRPQSPDKRPTAPAHPRAHQ